MNAINKAGPRHELYPTQDTLFFKIQGAPEVISNAAEALEAVVKKHHSSRFELASTKEHAREMWEDRKMALFSSLQLEPGLRCWTTDVWFTPVPYAMLDLVLTIGQRSGIPTPRVGVRNQEGPR